MNFEQLNVSPNKIELPTELIDLAKKGIHDADKTQDLLLKVSEAMVVRGISNDERAAYIKILQTLTQTQFLKLLVWEVLFIRRNPIILLLLVLDNWK